MADMHGKTVAITGATSGIGEVAAIRLADAGARIVFTARDEARAGATLEKLKRANPSARHLAHMADLSRLAGMRKAAAAIGEEPEIDVLINNAGAMFNRRIETADGIEKTFALNHLSYFVLTNLLLLRLKPGARIVSTASGAHRRARLDFGDLGSRRGYLGFAVYAKSKLCNLLFSRELARRVRDRGITANALHPGFVATRFGDQSGGVAGRVLRFAKPLTAIPPEEGAKTILYLATAPEVSEVSGQYFYHCAPETPSSEALKDDDARRLWEISAKIAGVG